MCYAMYIAADKPLPLLEWDEAHRSFYVREIDAREQGVRVQFTKPNVYYAGSHIKCGCGFVSLSLHFYI